MREILVLGMLTMGLWVSNKAHASVPSSLSSSLSNKAQCTEIAEQMKEYKAARHALMKGLIKKNDTMADTLDLFAERFENKKGDKVQTSDVARLKKSADSFRSHGTRETNLIERFEVSSDRLFERLNDCLKAPQPSVASQ